MDTINKCMTYFLGLCKGTDGDNAVQCRKGKLRKHRFIFKQVIF